MFRVKPLVLLAASLVAAAGGAWAQARDGARIRNRPLVVIDPGHGGKDPGAVSPVSGIAEKHVTLAVSRAIRDALLQGGRVRVAMTRNDDRFVPLHERVAVARRLGANLFVAVHGDSAPNPNASGATIYTLSEVASDAQAARLAAAENRRDGVDDVDLGVSDPSVRAILADLTQRETMATSADFAQTLRREAGATGVAFRAQPHRFANFVVLKASDTAAVLLEVDTDELVARLVKRAQEQGRTDDDEGTVRTRMQVYSDQTAPLVAYYEARGKLRRVAGVDHVGLGGDFDGMSAAPVGLEDVSKYPHLLAELARRGWTDAELEKLAGRNLLRVLRAAEATAVRLQAARPASLATFPPANADRRGP